MRTIEKYDSLRRFIWEACCTGHLSWAKYCDLFLIHLLSSLVCLYTPRTVINFLSFDYCRIAWNFSSSKVFVVISLSSPSLFVAWARGLPSSDWFEFELKETKLKKSSAPLGAKQACMRSHVSMGSAAKLALLRRRVDATASRDTIGRTFAPVLVAFYSLPFHSPLSDLFSPAKQSWVSCVCCEISFLASS